MSPNEMPKKVNRPEVKPRITDSKAYKQALAKAGVK
jgi:hypothetical protein